MTSSNSLTPEQVQDIAEKTPLKVLTVWTHTGGKHMYACSALGQWRCLKWTKNWTITIPDKPAMHGTMADAPATKTVTLVSEDGSISIVFHLERNLVAMHRVSSRGGQRSPYRMRKVLLSREQANQRIASLKSKGYREVSRNPGNIIDPGPAFFIEMAKMRQIQREILTETGKHLSIAEIVDLVRAAEIRRQRNQIRRVK